ncbi:CsbD family protein [Kribbella deserti]|uniref:CsbD family protein n=1 Tax=Kribbella deserti TaxID=1926257 RepID=A0ABV6QNG5_9ACTN
MGIADKARNAAEELAGKAKEAVGNLTDDKDLQAEGKTDQTKADLKNAGENIKDAFKK